MFFIVDKHAVVPPCYCGAPAQVNLHVSASDVLECSTTERKSFINRFACMCTLMDCLDVSNALFPYL